MITLNRRTNDPSRPVDGCLVLPFAIRQKSRFRAELRDGQPCGVVLERGGVLRHGDLLENDAGTVIRIEAAAEELSIGRAADPLIFARACYHLGNRHVPLHIEPGELRFQVDHVLEDMLRQLGVAVERRSDRFEPEAGAYGGSGAGGTHGHHH